MQRAFRIGLLGLVAAAGFGGCSSGDTDAKDLGVTRDTWSMSDVGGRIDVAGPEPDTRSVTPDIGVAIDASSPQDVAPPEDTTPLKENWLICTADDECQSGVCGYNMGCLNDENGQKVDSSLGMRCLPSSAYPKENSADGQCHS